MSWTQQELECWQHREALRLWVQEEGVPQRPREYTGWNFHVYMREKMQEGGEAEVGPC